ncbi:MAG: MFS transporter, partial [Bacteroidota bacterium]
MSTTTNSKLLYWSITVSLAGFLFGFDTIVISGAEQQLSELWGSYTLFGDAGLFHGTIVMSMALWGTVIGALFGGIPTDQMGRKKTLIWIGILYTVSAFGSALVSDPFSFAFFRFIGGLGVGASTIAAPAYISEIAPAKQRGRLVAMYQFNLVFGILLAFISNYLLRDIGENAWRYMIGIEGIPALIYTIMVLGVPNSPRWLMAKRNDRTGAKAVLQMLVPEPEAEEMLDAMAAPQPKSTSGVGSSGVQSGKI